MLLRVRLLLTGCAIAFSAQTFAVSYYTVTDLGELYFNSSAYDYQNIKLRINDNNQVVGWERNSKLGNAGFRAFTWNSSAQKLYPLPDTETHQLSDLNTATQYVGHVYDIDGYAKTTIWNSDFSSSTTLPTLGGNRSFSAGINSSGQVVGSSDDANGKVQAFFWNNGTLTAITNSIQGGNDAAALNDAGVVTGTSNGQAFSWNGTTLLSLNEINPDVTGSWAADINNSDQIVGGYHLGTLSNNTYPGTFRNDAFVWDSNTGFTDLNIRNDSSSWAIAINDTGVIVGGGMINNTTNGNDRRKAVLWENAVAYELNTLITNLSGWNLQDATDINSSGHIVGIGKLNGKFHAYMLTPQPEIPASADLSINAIILSTQVQKTASRGLSVDNNNQQLALKVSNHGPDNATNIKLSFASSLVADVQALESSKGYCDIDGSTNVINCSIDALVVNEEVTFKFNLKNTLDEKFDIEANVIADQIDPLTGDQNSVKEEVAIIANKITLSPSPEQNPGTETDAEKSTQSSGCTINKTASKTAGFDPLFYIMLLLASFAIYRNKKRTLY